MCQRRGSVWRGSVWRGIVWRAVCGAALCGAQCVARQRVGGSAWRGCKGQNIDLVLNRPFTVYERDVVGVYKPAGNVEDYRVSNLM